MTRNLGFVTPAGAPRAARASRASWRDPRLWIGVAIVAASVVVGARVLAQADDTIAVYTAASPIPVGMPLREAELEVRRIRFADAGQAARYLTAPLPADESLAFVRALDPGELVPVSAVSGSSVEDRVQLPISVDPNQIPPSVGVGDRVDVYILRPGSTAPGPASPALESASVVAAPDPAEAVVASSERQLVLAVPGQAAREFLAQLGRDDQARLTVVRRP